MCCVSKLKLHQWVGIYSLVMYCFDTGSDVFVSIDLFLRWRSLPLSALIDCGTITVDYSNVILGSGASWTQPSGLGVSSTLSVVIHVDGMPTGAFG